MKKILYLDDDDTLCFLMTELFQECGNHEVVAINSYAELLKLQSDIHLFDIIFLDVNLGNHVPSGLDAYAWLKNQHFLKQIIFFTGHAQAYPEVMEALNGGKVSVLEKPASVDEIGAMINT